MFLNKRNETFFFVTIDVNGGKIVIMLIFLGSIWWWSIVLHLCHTISTWIHCSVSNQLKELFYYLWPPNLKDINIIRRRSIQTMGCHYTARKNEFSLVYSLYIQRFLSKHQNNLRTKLNTVQLSIWYYKQSRRLSCWQVSF